MIRRADRPRAVPSIGSLSTCLLLGCACAPVAARAVVALTGEVRSPDAQAIYTPQANSAPLVIRYFVPEGQAVKTGDVVLRIDPGQSASMIPDLDAQIEQAGAKAAKELAELQVKAIDADVEAADADAAFDTARVDAAIPRELASALDYDRFQGELDRTRREAALKREERDAARAAVTRRQQDGVLEVRKLVVKRDYIATLVRTAEVRADRDGVVLHGYNQNWLTGRIDEGSSTMPGSKAGEVIAPGSRMQVRAWALESDRRDLHAGQPVRLDFDALPRRAASGRIVAISGAPESKAEWGDGRYFVVDIAMDAGAKLPLLPGMSVRVTLPASTAPAAGAAR
jgi:multidrug resistance efflux pump